MTFGVKEIIIEENQYFLFDCFFFINLNEIEKIFVKFEQFYLKKQKKNIYLQTIWMTN